MSIESTNALGSQIICQVGLLRGFGTLIAPVIVASPTTLDEGLVSEIYDIAGKYKDRCDNKTYYVDFRKVLERQDIDAVMIATPDHARFAIAMTAIQHGDRHQVQQAN